MKLGALRTENCDERGACVLELIGASEETLPESWDLRGSWSRTPNQIGESCHGHALAQAIRTISKGLIDVSAMSIYSIAQLLVDPTQKILPDIGAYSHLILDAVKTYGVVDIDRWPDNSDPEKIVTQDIFEAGSLSIVSGIFKLQEIGKARTFSMRRAISKGHPITFALDVGKSYMKYKGGIWQGETEDIIGGHANCIVAYDSECAIAANSHGKDYGESGHIRIAWSFFERISTESYNYNIVTLAPNRIL